MITPSGEIQIYVSIEKEDQVIICIMWHKYIQQMQRTAGSDPLLNGVYSSVF